jgi:ABC-2 type transport system permease protein
VTTIDQAEHFVLPDMPSTRMRNAYLLEGYYAFLRLWRNPGLSLPSLLFPVAFYLLVGFLFGAFKDPKAALYLLGGFTTMGAMSPGMFVLGIVFANEREQGLYQLRRAQPTPALAILAGIAMMAAISTLIATTLLLAVAIGLGAVDIPIPAATAFTLIASLGAIPFCALGLLLGSVLSAKAAPGVVNVVYIVLSYFSGLFIPLPEAIQSVVLASPCFYLHQLLLELIGADNFIVASATVHVVVLLAVTLLCFGLAIRRLERTL